MEFLNRVYLNNRIMDYLIVLGVFILSILVIQIIRMIILRRLKAWAEETLTTIDDFLLKIISRVVVPLLYLGTLYFCLKGLTLHPTFEKSIEIAGVILLTFFCVRLVIALTEYVLIDRMVKQDDSDENREKKIRAILPALKFVIYGLGVVFLLDNLGFKISTVVAGLGIGGIAVALAAQAVLGDLFSYFSIMFDRPFELGDFIVIGDYLGTVEYVGIKTTRLRSLSGEQLVIGNSDLTSSRIRNYKRMEKRRILFHLGVVYQTPIKVLREIPGVIQELISSREGVAFDRCHFSSLGDFSLNFETVYYVLNSDYSQYMSIQQEINLAIMEEFEKRGVEFAYPTQTLFLTKE